ncbi:MAG: hypothetical protein V4693_12255 [Pseudomonadota bacterium]
MLRRSLPLALTIAVHLLLLASFCLARRAPTPTASPGPVTYMLALVRPSIPPPVRQQIKKPEVRIATPPQTVRAARAAPVVRAPSPQDEAPAAEALVAAPVAGDLVERAKREVGKIDLALRAGKAVALSADSPRARFERLMASAYIDRSNTMTVDRYESGDGVFIERITRRGKASCYMSGTVNFVPGILKDSSKPQTATCPPAGEGWTRQ